MNFVLEISFIWSQFHWKIMIMTGKNVKKKNVKLCILMEVKIIHKLYMDTKLALKI